MDHQLLAREDVTASLASSDRVFWPLSDHLGTTRDLIDNAGDLREHYEYESFGQILSGDTSLTRYLFTAREHDPATGLNYHRARWYDSAVGRWLSEDPIGFAARDANLTRLVRNSPVASSDPSGLRDPDEDERWPFGPRPPWGGSPRDWDTYYAAPRPASAPQPPPAVTQAYPIPKWDWTLVPSTPKAQLLAKIPVLKPKELATPTPDMHIPGGGTMASQVVVVHQMQPGKLYGPSGCGPCTGAIVVPQIMPSPLPTYIVHLEPTAMVGEAFKHMKLSPDKYRAILVGVEAQDGALVANASLNTFGSVIAHLRARHVTITAYVPAPALFVDRDGVLYRSTSSTPTNKYEIERLDIEISPDILRHY